jgi:hypothetical protein
MRRMSVLISLLALLVVTSERAIAADNDFRITLLGRVIRYHGLSVLARALLLKREARSCSLMPAAECRSA